MQVLWIYCLCLLFVGTMGARDDCISYCEKVQQAISSGISIADELEYLKRAYFFCLKQLRDEDLDLFMENKECSQLFTNLLKLLFESYKKEKLLVMGIITGHMASLLAAMTRANLLDTFISVHETYLISPFDQFDRRMDCLYETTESEYDSIVSQYDADCFEKNYYQIMIPRGTSKNEAVWFTTMYPYSPLSALETYLAVLTHEFAILSPTREGNIRQENSFKKSSCELENLLTVLYYISFASASTRNEDFQTMFEEGSIVDFLLEIEDTILIQEQGIKNVLTSLLVKNSYLLYEAYKLGKGTGTVIPQNSPAVSWQVLEHWHLFFNYYSRSRS